MRKDKETEWKEKERENSRRNIYGKLCLDFLVDQLYEIRALVLHNCSKIKIKNAKQGKFHPTDTSLNRLDSRSSCSHIQYNPNLSWVQCLMVWLSITCMQCVRTVSTRVRLFKMRWVGGWVDGGVEEFSRAGKWSTQIPEFTARCPPNRIN